MIVYLIQLYCNKSYIILLQHCGFFRWYLRQVLF